jgi:hypothetical protein
MLKYLGATFNRNTVMVGLNDTQYFIVYIKTLVTHLAISL